MTLNFKLQCWNGTSRYFDDRSFDRSNFNCTLTRNIYSRFSVEFYVNVEFP